MGVGAHHRGDPAIQVIGQGPAFPRWPRRKSTRMLGVLPPFRMRVDAVEGVFQRLHIHHPLQVDHAELGTAESPGSNTLPPAPPGGNWPGGTRFCPRQNTRRSPGGAGAWLPVVITSTRCQRGVPALCGRMPLPSAEFSPLATTRSIFWARLKAGSLARTASHPLAHHVADHQYPYHYTRSFASKSLAAARATGFIILFPPGFAKIQAVFTKRSSLFGDPPRMG